MENIDINKILVSKKEPYGNKGAFRYFIGYNDNDKVCPLCIKFPQMIGCVRHFQDGNKTMPLKVTDKELLKRHIKTWGKINSLMEIEFANKPVFGSNDGEYIKTKIKSYGGKINTNFYNKKEERKVTKRYTPCK